MRTFILLLCCFLSTGLTAQTQQALIGQWQASSFEYGVFLTFNWTIINNGQSMVRITAGNRYIDEAFTWEYVAPVITLKKENKTAFKGEIKWQGKDQFTLVVIDDGNPYNRGLKRYYYRQKEQALVRDNSSPVPNQIPASPQKRKCPNCNGTGIYQTCQVCYGSGRQQRTEYRADGSLETVTHQCTNGCVNGKIICMGCRGRGYKDF